MPGLQQIASHAVAHLAQTQKSNFHLNLQPAAQRKGPSQPQLYGLRRALAYFLSDEKHSNLF
jgi:hypothetical protein